jgi:DNA modification methylase
MKKFKVSDKTLNPFQKPLLLFMKHILCWSNEGDLIIDATSGSGTTAVS